MKAVRFAAFVVACAAFAVPPQIGEQSLVQADVKIDVCSQIKTVVASLAEDEYFDEAAVQGATKSGQISLEALQTVLHDSKKHCTVCTQDHYTSTACTNVTDSACAECGVAQAGEFVVTACQHGSIRVAGKKTEVSKCTEPTNNKYVKVACTHEADTQFGDCPTPTEGETYVSKACVAGTHDTVGTIGEVSPCTKSVDGKFRSEVCKAGSAFVVGADATFVDCSKPTGDQYTTHACANTANAQFDNCPKPATGQYVAKACVAGSHSEVGHRGEVKDCTHHVDGKYLTKECSPGTTFAAGADAEFTACSNPTESKFVTAACTDSADTKFGECPKPIAGESYVAKACVAGSHTTVGQIGETNPCTKSVIGMFRSGDCHAGGPFEVGADATFSPCSDPTNDKFVLHKCSDTEDTKFGDCPKPGDGQYVSKACDAGSHSTVGSIGEISKCTVSVPNKYRSQDCKQGSAFVAGVDAQFTDCTSPSGDHFVSAVCGEASDTKIDKCTAPQSGQYVSKVCVAGDHKTKGHDSEVLTCTVSADGKYRSKDCAQGSPFAAGSDAKFTTCTEPSGDQYVLEICEATTDTKFGDCPTPVNGETFVSKACVAGSHTTPGSIGEVHPCTKSVEAKFRSQECKPGTPFASGSDAVYSDCTNPSGDKFVSQICGETADTKIGDCPRPGDGQYVSKACEAGSYKLAGVIGAVQTCTTTVPGKFRSQDCKQGTAFAAGSNAVFTTCTEPSGDQYVTAICADAENTQFGVCESAKDNHYVSKACVAGTHSTKGRPSEVSACSPAVDGKYRSVDCVGGDAFHVGSDAQYKSCTEPTSAQYVTAACSTTADTKLSSCATQGSGEFISTACVHGTSTTAGTDTKIEKCTVCTQSQVQKKACSTTSDTQCEDLCGKVGTVTAATNDGTITPLGCTKPVLLGQFYDVHDDKATVRAVEADGKFRFGLTSCCASSTVTGTEKFDYIVLEEGSNSEYTVGTATISKTFTEVTWTKDYGKYPLVFATTLSRNNKHFGVVRVQATGNHLSTQLKIQTDELTGATNAEAETVGYLVFKSGCSTEPAAHSNADRCGLADTEGASKVLRTGTITIAGISYKFELGLFFTHKGQDQPNIYSFTTKFSSAPVVLSQMLTTNGGNPSFIRSISTSSTEYKFTADEEQCKDPETWHLSEFVGILAIGL